MSMDTTSETMRYGQVSCGYKKWRKSLSGPDWIEIDVNWSTLGKLWPHILTFLFELSLLIPPNEYS